MSISDPDGPVSVREVAELLAVHPQTVRRLIHEGKLEGVRIGSRLFVPRAALESLVSRQRRNPRL
ncbi:MAG TPA: helix-turn-helix domain-containing protein [Gaiellaceae bacterium]|nr:helix-turn-helix domain-containing protein [Gaiellaceae bacterium]